MEVMRGMSKFVFHDIIIILFFLHYAVRWVFSVVLEDDVGHNLQVEE